MIEIIRHKEAWDAVIDRFGEGDFYHTYDYHEISRNSNELPVLVKYEEGDKLIALPLLLRKIEGTPYRDATSVYGYPGPLTLNVDSGFDNAPFRKAFRALLIENNYVSVFSRLNPFISGQEFALHQMEETVTLGKVIYINLKRKPEEQLRHYNKRLRTYINKCRRKYEIKKALSRREVKHFIAMYYENMRRVDAKPKYFFEESYFFRLLQSASFETDILLATDLETQSVVAGAMFIKKNRIVQYHLSGVKEEYLNLNPVKLLLDEMRIRATNEGYSYLNLGGGVGNREDSLFQFKSGYSKDREFFKVWRYIANEELYRELVQEKEQKNCDLDYKKCYDFFPCYRCEIR